MIIDSKQLKSARSGFTLVEIIVVLVILAILAAIIVPSMTGWIDNAADRSLVVACRTCVNAAQTLATEEYAMKGKNDYPPTNEDILKLAGITEGTDKKIKLDNVSLTSYGTGSSDPTVSYLTYSENGRYCTYVNNSTPHYVLSLPVEWETGQTYKVGDIMTSNGFVFRCIRAHTTGTTSRTRNPALRSNKSTWEVIGYTGEPLTYSSTVRYAVGFEVEHEGYIYKRINFNLVGGQVPEFDPPRSSDYWVYLRQA